MMCGSGCGPSETVAPAPELLVAVAANAQPPVEEIVRGFTAQSGVKVTLSAGASGVLQRQAEEGAPFDVFISADMARVEALAARGVIDPATVAPYAEGVLVLWQPDGDGPRLSAAADLSRAEFAQMRVAIAHPEQAPYGAAARQTLQKLDLWSRLEPNIIYGESVGQALQFAKTGNVGAAFIPLSLVPAHGGTAIEIEAALHDPILQGLGILARTRQRAAAEAFARQLRGPEGEAVWRRHGYKIPSPVPARNQ